jgi:hypothetical protein
MDIADRLHSQYAHLGPQYAPKEDTTGQNLEGDLAKSLRGQNLVARELRSSYQAGRFPSITRLFVQDLHDYGSVLQDDWRVNTVDILLGRIEVIPIVCIDLEVDPGNQADQESAHDLEATAYYLKEHGHLRFLDENVSDIHVCPNIFWATSTTGVRVLKKTRGLSKYDLDWVDPMRHGMDLREFLERIGAEHSKNMALLAGRYINSIIDTVRTSYVLDGILEWYE